MSEYILPEGHVLCLRTNDKNNQSRGGFQWPESGECIAPDWSGEIVCGYGLHGLLWGVGDASLLKWSPDAKWLVVEVLAESMVDLSGKVKFPRCNVIYCGDRFEATGLITKFAPVGTPVVGGTATAGYRGTATAGDRGIIQFSYWDNKASRRRIITKYVGEDGIKANTPYTVDDVGNVTEAIKKGETE